MLAVSQLGPSCYPQSEPGFVSAHLICHFCLLSPTRSHSQVVGSQVVGEWELLLGRVEVSDHGCRFLVHQ